MHVCHAKALDMRPCLSTFFEGRQLTLTCPGVQHCFSVRTVEVKLRFQNSYASKTWVQKQKPIPGICGDGGHREACTYDLAQRGFTVITGRNEDDQGSESNGAGKSALVMAPLWALTGKSDARNEASSARLSPPPPCPVTALSVSRHVSKGPFWQTRLPQVCIPPLLHPLPRPLHPCP